MYKIMNLVCKREPAGQQRPFVHSFYKTMFMKLYGMDEKEAGACIEKNGMAAYSRDFLEPLVKKVWEKHKDCVSQFYDIRINEETGQIAPEYAILKKAGISNVTPVSIRGMGSMALLFGLQAIEISDKEQECTIVLLAELEHDFKTWQEDAACAFALYPCKNTDSQNEIWITDYRMHLSIGEIKDAVRNFGGTAVFSEVELEDVPVTCEYILCRKYGLTAPLFYLHQKSGQVKPVDVLVVYASGKQYGLIYYHI